MAKCHVGKRWGIIFLILCFQVTSHGEREVTGQVPNDQNLLWALFLFGPFGEVGGYKDRHVDIRSLTMVLLVRLSHLSRLIST